MIFFKKKKELAEKKRKEHIRKVNRDMNEWMQLKLNPINVKIVYHNKISTFKK